MIKLRSPIKCSGSKNRIARRIAGLMTDHDTYVEAFAGGLSVLLNKKPANRELAVDTNPAIMEFYRVFTRKIDEFMDHVGRLQYNRDEFNLYKNMRPSSSLERAVRYFVLNQMSFCGQGECFSWCGRQRGGQPASVNAWRTLVDSLPLIAMRLKNVRFIQDSALDVIRRVDDPKTLIYCDPPDMSDYFTFTHEEHRDLLNILLSCSSTVLISGSVHPLYEKMLAGKTSMQFYKSKRNGSCRTEKVWMILGGH